MARRIHLHVSVDGALRNPEPYIGAVKVDGKTLNTRAEVKAFFEYQRAMGRKLLPLGECDNFDYETGCRGHEIEEESGCEYCGDEFVPALNWQYGLDHILPDYKYCPMCGRNLREE